MRNYQLGFANTLMDKIKKSRHRQLSFAWAGSLKAGAGHYYRIQGPLLLIEYDNTQNNANHVHGVVRDLTNDFAEDILREHYVKEHNTQNQVNTLPRCDDANNGWFTAFQNVLCWIWSL